MEILDRLRALPQSRLRARYRECFGTPAGRAVLRDLFDFCGIRRSSIFASDGGKIDPHEVLAQEGCRRAALRIAHFLDMTDEELLKLAKGDSYDDESTSSAED